MRRLFVVSSGSMEASIIARNAEDRLRSVALDGFFGSVDYVFFRTEESRSFEFAPSFRVHEVSGWVPGPLRERLPALRRLAIFVSGLWQIAAIARRTRPTVVAAVEPFVSGLVAKIVSSIHHVPFVITLVSDYELTRQAGGRPGIPFLPGIVSALVERFLLRRADRVVTHTEHYRNYAIRRGADPRNVAVFPIYAAGAFYEMQPDASVWQRLGVLDETPLLYVGRLSPEKYCLDLIDCLEAVETMSRGRVLVVIGDGPQREELLERAEDRGLRERIFLAGGLPAADIFSAMAACGAMLVTHGAYALLEGALAAAPMAAYDYEWHGEIVQNEQTGLLVPYRDPLMLARAARRLLDDRDLAARLGAAARSLAHDRYRPDLATATLMEHFVAVEDSHRDRMPVGSKQ